MIEEATNYIEDDWADNSLTTRTGSEAGYFLHPSDKLQDEDVEAGTVLKGIYRPRWENVSGSVDTSDSDVRASNSGSPKIVTPSDLEAGSVSFEWSWIAIGSDADAFFGMMFSSYPQTGFDNFVSIYFRDSGSADPYGYSLRIRENGADRFPIDSIWDGDKELHSSKLTRTTYGEYELFYDNTSVGTSTDTFKPENYEFALQWGDSNGGSEIKIDNLVIN